MKAEVFRKSEKLRMLSSNQASTIILLTQIKSYHLNGNFMKLKQGLILIFFILTISLSFAAPGGGGGGHGGGPSGGGRGGPGPSSSSSRQSFSKPGSSSSPSFSAPARPSSPSRPGPSNNSASPSARNSDRPLSPPSEQGSSSEKSSPVSDQEIFYYRGSRVVAAEENFTVQSIKSEKTSGKEINVEITFNQDVNPLTFNENSILIDGQALPAATKFAFNKKGDTMRVSVPLQKDNFSLKIQNIESYDGTIIEPIEMDNIPIGEKQ